MIDNRKLDFVLFLSSDYGANKILRLIKGIYDFKHRISINSFPAEYDYSTVRLRNYIDLISSTLDSPNLSLSANYYIPKEDFRAEVDVPYVAVLSDPIKRICFEFLSYQMMLAQSPFEPDAQDRTRTDIRAFADDLYRNNVTTRLFGQVSLDQEIDQSQFDNACERLSQCSLIYKVDADTDQFLRLRDWLVENSRGDLSDDTVERAYKRALSIFVSNEDVSVDIDLVSIFPGIKQKPGMRQVHRLAKSLDDATLSYLKNQNAFDTTIWEQFSQE
jgi:hypothetical protein